MTAPLNLSIADSPTETLADVRDAMSRRGDFNPTPEHYANDLDVFKVQAVMEALTIEGAVEQ